MSKLRLLVIDDEPLIRRGIRKIPQRGRLCVEALR